MKMDAIATDKSGHTDQWTFVCKACPDVGEGDLMDEPNESENEHDQHAEVLEALNSIDENNEKDSVNEHDWQGSMQESYKRMRTTGKRKSRGTTRAARSRRSQRSRMATRRSCSWARLRGTRGAPSR